jgi:hypothetical protein
MAALRASRLVWSAIITTACTMSPIWRDCFSSSAMRLPDCWFLAEASLSCSIMVSMACRDSSAAAVPLVAMALSSRNLVPSSSAERLTCTAATRISSALAPTCSPLPARRSIRVENSWAAALDSSMPASSCSEAAAMRSAMPCCLAMVRALAFSCAILRAISRLRAARASPSGLAARPILTTEAVVGFAVAGVSSFFAIL